MREKVFVIGLPKTGTTSLAEALRRLGYRVTGPNGVNDPMISENALPMAVALTKEYDAFQDDPWHVLYKELDKRYPGSKFILTVRSTDSWIASQVRYFGQAKTPMRKWIYGEGSPFGHEDVYIARYESHNEEVLGYFADRPNDLLVMELSADDGWGKLCPFLGAEIPDSSFPHKNKGGTQVLWKLRSFPPIKFTRRALKAVRRRIRRIRKMLSRAG